MYDINELDVYNMALDFSNLIWKICSKFSETSNNLKRK